MSNQTPTRRSLLTGAAAYAVGATIATTGVTAMTDAKGAEPAPISSHLASLIAEAERCNAAARHHDSHVYEPAYAQWQAARGAVPHVEVEGFSGYDGGPARWSTDQEGRVRSALAATKGRVAFHGAGSEDARLYYRAQRRLAAAHLRRERALAHARRPFDPTYAESTRLDELTYAADMAVTRFPAATLPDLLAILGFMEDRGLADDQHCIDMLSAGIRRLAGEA